MDEKSKPGKILLHFGMPKTGSTSIQKSLYSHLDDPDFYYIDLGRANASKGTATAFRHPDRPPVYYVKMGTSPAELEVLRKNAVAELDKEINNAGSRTAILSAEALYNLRADEFREFHNKISAHQKPIMAVGYIRRPKEYIESIFQHRIKTNKDLRVSTIKLNYRAHLEKFDEVIGMENVRFRLFDPNQFQSGCVVQEFCSSLGIEFRPENVIQSNAGLSSHALSLLFAYRKFGPGYGTGADALEENRLLARKIRELEGPKLHLKSSLTKPVIERYRDDIEWVEKRLDASMQEDITLHDEQALHSEEELLNFSPKALQWLTSELGLDYSQQRLDRIDPIQVANWMQQLRLKLGSTRMIN